MLMCSVFCEFDAEVICGGSGGGEGGSVSRGRGIQEWHVVVVLFARFVCFARFALFRLFSPFFHLFSHQDNDITGMGTPK